MHLYSENPSPRGYLHPWSRFAPVHRVESNYAEPQNFRYRGHDIVLRAIILSLVTCSVPVLNRIWVTRSDFGGIGRKVHISAVLGQTQYRQKRGPQIYCFNSLSPYSRSSEMPFSSWFYFSDLTFQHAFLSLLWCYLLPAHVPRTLVPSLNLLSYSSSLVTIALHSTPLACYPLALAPLTYAFPSYNWGLFHAGYLALPLHALCDLFRRV